MIANSDGKVGYICYPLITIGALAYLRRESHV